ncbi:hypothetical protein B0T10DRAFT_476850 [Thelonectria olida]|uniref:Uncharacterized protein n=1 Tax=Thelonectria olida TaxID=1576542 RepID=A0A9P9AUK4_9HYPO|nr:hypothetical protein B0T10DRAFT_476850 [Thelonectria olida]
MLRQGPASEPRHRPTRSRRSSERGVGGPEMQTRPYLLEWSAQTCRQRNIRDVEDMREEMGVPDRAGWARLVIMRGSEIDMDLVSGGASELAEGRGKRRVGSWAWEYPELEMVANLFDGPAKDDPPSTSRYPPERSPLEVALWEALGDSRPLEDVLSEVAYDAWLDTLDALPREGDSVDVLWALAHALENNADTAKRMERRNRAFAIGGIASEDWTALADRLHRRMQLSVALSVRRQQRHPDASRDSNSRSLNRIAYLGGLLLPLTVVSGILSIEGTYGPEGKAFWVFWLASGLCSVLAILVIYADHLRTLDVWMEVAAGEVLEGLDPSDGFHALRHHRHAARPRRDEAGFQAMGDAERGEATAVTTAADGGVYVVQRRGDGTRGRAWRRKELGWMGAMKKMSGYYMWRGSPGIEFRMPASSWGERLTDLW